MPKQRVRDRWEGGDAYEHFMGRWSYPLAQSFVRWLNVPQHLLWLDIGCGAGALTRAISESAKPEAVVACDASEDFVRYAQSRLPDSRLTFVVADAMSPPSRPSGFDVIVSGFVLNFLPDPRQALIEMRRRTRPGGTIAACVWDYAAGMEFLRYFWDAAKNVDPRAASLDEGVRFPLCDPTKLQGVFEAADLCKVTTGAIDAPTTFESFDDYWQPFLGGVGPAPSYVASLEESNREELRRLLERTLPADRDGGIHLTARAWAVRGSVP